MLVSNELCDLFLKDLLKIPPNRGIDFGIDVLPDTQLIIILSYRMAPLVL